MQSAAGFCRLQVAISRAAWKVATFNAKTFETQSISRHTALPPDYRKAHMQLTLNTIELKETSNVQPSIHPSKFSCTLNT
jgi:hypothetical protein